MPVRKYQFNSREEWLQARKNHIGGSDASACVGMNPYKDNVQLWEEKKGLIIPEDISERDYVQYGTKAEEYLRGLFSLDFPQYQVLYEENNMFLNSDYPWMHASLDGELIDGEGRHGVLEIKTTNILQSLQKASGAVNCESLQNIILLIERTPGRTSGFWWTLKSGFGTV